MRISTRVALAACVALGAVVPASATHSWGGYHWAGNGSNLAIKVNKAITSQWATSVNTSISDWDASNELNLVNQSAPAGTSAKRCNPIAGQILVCNAAYGQRGWLGIASIWLTSGHISQATTKLNDSYFSLTKYNTPAWRALVACQEIGHDYGLDHQDENFSNVNLGTCMDYTNAPAGGVVGGFNYGSSNEHPNDHDYAELTIIYNHDDGFTTTTAATNFGIRQVGKPVPQSDAGVGDSPGEWGRAIHHDALGRPDVFEKYVGSRKKVLTHVFWALGEGPE